MPGGWEEQLSNDVSVIRSFVARQFTSEGEPEGRRRLMHARDDIETVFANHAESITTEQLHEIESLPESVTFTGSEWDMFSGRSWEPSDDYSTEVGLAPTKQLATRELERRRRGSPPDHPVTSHLRILKAENPHHGDHAKIQHELNALVETMSSEAATVPDAELERIAALASVSFRDHHAGRIDISALVEAAKQELARRSGRQRCLDSDSG